MALFALTVLLLIASACLRIAHSHFRPYLCEVPGPFLAKSTDLWKLVRCLRGTLHVDQLQLHTSYSSTIVRIGPKSVSLANPASIKSVYGYRTAFKKSTFYGIFSLPQNGQFAPSLFSSLDEAYHRDIRRAIGKAYQSASVRRILPGVHLTIQKLMASLDGIARSGDKVDLGVWLKRYTFDATSEITFGRAMGFMETESDVSGIMADIKWKVDVGATMAQVPLLSAALQNNPAIRALFDNHPIVQFATARLRQHTRDPNGFHQSPTTFMDLCFDARQKSPDIVTDRAICMYCVENIMAGSEATTIALQAVSCRGQN